MQDVFKRIALVAATNTPVLISGESGTGKELVARAIHRHSTRYDRPLIPINIAALNPSLIESELFGHVRGAFTGAEQPRTGLLELANGGTVFFDEVAEIPLPIQVKILRVIEQGELLTVGSSQPQQISLRFLAATNRDLATMCSSGEFREDLFFRLAVFEIRLPPLRERREDIPLLAEKFLQKLSSEQVAASYFDASALEEMNRRYWRGNVRELRNAVEYAALVARGGPIMADHLPPPIEFVAAESKDNIVTTMQQNVKQWFEANNGEIPRGMLYDEFLPLVEAPLFSAVLEKTHMNHAAAAEWLGIHRATLRKRLDRINEQEP